MKTKAEEYQDNAANCAEIEAKATERPRRKRYERMKEAWLALARHANWLDGKRKAEEK